MGLALEAGYELGGILVCFVVIALLALALAVVESVHAAINISILGQHPFGGIANKLHNAVIRPLNKALHDTEKLNAKFLSGLVDAFGMVIAIPLLLAWGVKAAFQYLWGHALRPLIHSIVDTVQTDATHALSGVLDATGKLTGAVQRAEDYADTVGVGAVSAAKKYADHWIDNAVSVLNGNIADALASAHRYADTAVGKLRSAEDTAIADAVGIANAARTAGIEAARDALGTARGEITTAKNAALAAAAGALVTAEHYTDTAKDAAIAAAGGALATAEDYADALHRIAEADAAALAAGALTTSLAAVQTVESIAIDVQGDLADIESAAGPLGAAALIASIPAIATLVHAIATEAGLERPDCRGKVKGICGTDTSAWTELLGGLAALGFAFNLREMHDVATSLVGELADVIREAA